MKICPQCQRQYADEAMKFCLDDGSLLVAETDAAPGVDANATLHLPGRSTEQPPTVRSTQQSTIRAISPGPIAGGGMSVASDNPRSRALLWVLLALIIGGSGIVIALIVTRGRQQESASVLPAATPIASPGSISGSDAVSSTTESKGPAKAGETERLNQQNEKATPVPKATPAGKPTPVKAEVRETPNPPPVGPRAPISGGVLNGKAVSLVKPSYPPIAKAAHASGTVTVQVLIDENGKVVSAHAVSGHPLLQSAAVAAARASRFTPTRLSGQPVKVSGVIIYNFQAQ
jgi:TonB family protein